MAKPKEAKAPEQAEDECCSEEIPCCIKNDCGPINFVFDLLETVEIDASKETGIIIARAEYATSENSYLVRYKANDGRAVENWWSESALSFI